MTSVLIIFAVIAGLWLVAGCAVQRKMMFPRFMLGPAEPDDVARPPGVERWPIEHDAGVTEAWFMPGDGASAAHPGPAVIFAHGNAELIDHNIDWLTMYTDLGVSVLLVEYRGYGRSDGSPTQADITADFIAGYDQLAARAEVDPQRIVFHGRSIGGGVMCSVAQHRTPAALILQSTFTSAGAMAAKFLYPPFLMLDPFANDKVLADYDGPVLLMHGSGDTVIPASHSRQLNEIAPDSKLIEYDSNHNDFPVGSAKFRHDIEAFLTANGLLNPAVPSTE